MRVVISALWGATQPSGICRTVDGLVRGIKEIASDVELAIVVGKWQRGYFEDCFEINSSNVRLVDVDIRNNSVSRNLWYVFGLPRLARRVSADIVHMAFPAPVIRSAFHCPIVTTLHDLYPYDSPSNFGYPHVFANRMALRRAISAADRVICVSDFTLSRFRERFPVPAAHKGVHIANAIVASTSAEAGQSQIDGPLFLAVAQHRANKNLNLLLRAFNFYRSLTDAKAGLKLVIVGMDGPETTRLHHLVDRLSLHETVVFLAGLTEGELAALYRDCELFVTLSSVEGFGLPLREAIESGSRVVASDIPAHGDVERGRCEFVALGGDDEVSRVVAAFQQALSSPRRFSTSSRQQSPSRTASKYLDLYSAAVRGQATKGKHPSNELSTLEHR
ncbi:glycosyl transferase, group 1 [Candidatus Koribacter versatilis Ellin345]|uniref:Glycosyl transferase, group 1 n=1 Tax=Koribacter versatilis (strain Ellin345) TaxID=204669 RepID=Q1ITA4_KORVE|nr:glycosyltransferase family 1 protein [Candidatus Koribacter versatilis]ABF39896.1 glycosyl transferase, group 1 [Candidatus Koribacter versatilis Ellin345]